MAFPFTGFGSSGAGGGGGGSAPRRLNRGSGPVAGLQSSAPQTMRSGGGGGGLNAAYPGYAGNQQYNRNVMQQHSDSPFINQQGGYTYATGPAPMPVGTNGMGRNIYGWVNGQPVFTPTQNYVQFAPGEGPGTPRPQSAGPSAPNPGPMGGLIDAIPMMPREAEIPRIDDTEAVREAYARAKDTAGQQGRAAMDSLQDVLGARGMVNSGIGVNEAGGVIAEGARQLGDFNREQAIQRVENERQRQFANYQGRIGQRGQDMNWQQLELQRRRWNAENSPMGHIQGGGVNPIPGYPKY